MPGWFKDVVSPLVSFAILCLGTVLTLRSIKSTSPLEALKQRFEKHKRDSDEKFGSDNRRLNHLERGYERTEELDRMLLRSVKAMLGHLAEGNHTGAMREEIKAIDEYLVSR